MGPERNARAPQRKPRKIVLCFDGTGNKFHGDDSDSNILKIYRMLDRTANDQYHYYQPGIGTYVVSTSLSHTGTVARLKSWYLKAKDSAIGSSFDQHVVGGYRFLMRFYNTGDEIYIFGFSRGAYIARFLAEMLDYVGLLSHGNEEMVAFAWKAFSNWQSRRDSKTAEGVRKKREMYAFMRGFRETFSRPVRRIRFLGLFDTVNSVPRFEAAWMQRAKFPYTARTSAKVIRHAVSIDERRAKFRQDLLYQSERGGTQNSKAKERSRPAQEQKPEEANEKYRRRESKAANKQAADRGRRATLQVPDDPAPYRARSHSTQRSRRAARRMTDAAEGHSAQGRRDNDNDNNDDDHADDDDAKSARRDSVAPHPHDEDASVVDSLGGGGGESEDETDQDIDEVWFAGGHADIGGGWEMLPDSKAASHVPLVWMVREAIGAGLRFDPDRVREMGCVEALDDHDDDDDGGVCMSPPAPGVGGDHETDNNPVVVPEGTDARDAANAKGRVPIPDIMVRSDSASTPKLFQQVSFGGPSNNNNNHNHHTCAPDESTSSSPSEAAAAAPLTFKEMMHKAHVALIHDSLTFGGGLSWGSTLAWNIMEYLPFRRMDLQADGSWKPIRWPLPCGEVRDIPEDARIHGSVIRRLHLDEAYRPGNLIIGGGGRGVRRAPKEHGTGDWVCVDRDGCPIGEVWMRRSAYEKTQDAAAGEKGNGGR